MERVALYNDSFQNWKTHDIPKAQLILSVYLPAERKQCEYIWKPVYTEYRRIGYRLENTLFD